MKPASFRHVGPREIDETVLRLAELGDEAKILAGGQSLIPMLALRLASFEHLIDIGRVDSLRGIEPRESSVRVTSGTTEAEVGRSEEVAASVPLLARSTPFIGHFQIRNRGTLGGSIAHADPAAEYPAVALTLDAHIELQSVRGTRTVAAADFFEGFWSTAAQPDELLIAVDFPVWHGRCGFAIEEFARRSGDFAIAGATVAIEVDRDDRIERCAIGLIGLGPTPLRARAAEQAVIGELASDLDADEIGRLATADLDDVPTDVHGSADYRTRVGAVMVARALPTAILEATSHA